MDQKQSLGRRRGARAFGSAVRSRRLPRPASISVPDHVAHHVLQEAAAADAIDQAPVAAREHRGIDRAHLGLALGIARVAGGEGGEIVLAFEDARAAAIMRSSSSGYG